MDYRSLTDAELARLAADDDADAFQELTRRYLKHLFNFARQYVRDRESAEDVAQDAFFKAWKHIRRFKQGLSFKTWLFAIARNTALDHIKKKKAVSFSDMGDGSNDDVDDVAETFADDEPLPHEIFERAELGAKIEEAMSILPPDHRAVVVMHYREEMTFEEIAIALKKPMNTVKSWHRRSLAKMRDRLMHLK